MKRSFRVVGDIPMRGGEVIRPNILMFEIGTGLEEEVRSKMSFLSGSTTQIPQNSLL